MFRVFFCDSVRFKCDDCDKNIRMWGMCIQRVSDRALIHLKCFARSRSKYNFWLSGTELEKYETLSKEQQAEIKKALPPRGVVKKKHETIVDPRSGLEKDAIVLISGGKPWSTSFEIQNSTDKQKFCKIQVLKSKNESENNFWVTFIEGELESDIETWTTVKTKLSSSGEACRKYNEIYEKKNEQFKSNQGKLVNENQQSGSNPPDAIIQSATNNATLKPSAASSVPPPPPLPPVLASTPKTVPLPSSTADVKNNETKKPECKPELNATIEQQQQNDENIKLSSVASNPLNMKDALKAALLKRSVSHQMSDEEDEPNKENDDGWTSDNDDVMNK